MKSTYIIEWKVVEQNQHTKATFEATSIDEAIKLLVKFIKAKNISPANIEILSIYCNGNDLSIDGILAAETSLQNFY